MSNFLLVNYKNALKTILRGLKYKNNNYYIKNLKNFQN